MSRGLAIWMWQIKNWSDQIGISKKNPGTRHQLPFSEYMRLKQLRIKNFRAIENVDVSFDTAVNVIVGPNAIGKSSLLEAIRLAKAVLAARSQNEALQSLIALGCISPHMPQRLIAESIARRSGPVSIKCAYELTPEEVKDIENSLPLIATNLVQTRMAQGFGNPAAFTAFLSSIPGRETLRISENELKEGLKTLQANHFVCRLDLTIDFETGRIDGADASGQAFLAYLDQRHPANLTCFSYFPADRALPSGDQPVQIGVADLQAQIDAHNATPQTKYTRLKNTIFNAVIAGDAPREKLWKDFGDIFSGVLKGRTLVDVGVNSFGLLTIKVRDNESRNTFSIDAMSSGEKGLILTCLLLSQSLVEGGVVLLDEPELHLNPAVCKTLLSFLIEFYVTPKKLQLIVCSHSPEILAGAIESDDCSLYHFLSSTLISKVQKRDDDEVTEALASLGTSESEGLLYKATIFVEGDEDLDVLEAGFGETLRRHKLKDLGGRKEVEKQIKKLQKLEKEGHETTPRYFIFDRDNAPSGLSDSKNVKVLQWKRRCLENYLLDIDALTPLLKDVDIITRPLANQGEVSKKLSALAKAQLDDFIAKQVYDGYKYESPGLRPSETKDKTLEEVAAILYKRLSVMAGQSTTFSQEWPKKFLQDCEARRKEVEPIWDADWKNECDGKKLFVDLHSDLGIKISPRKFKRRVITEMRKTPPSENWRAVESLLKDLIE